MVPATALRKPDALLIPIDLHAFQTHFSVTGHASARGVDGRLTKILALDMSGEAQIERHRSHTTIPAQDVPAQDRLAVIMVLSGTTMVVRNQSAMTAGAGSLVIANLASNSQLRMIAEGKTRLVVAILGRHCLGMTALDRLGHEPMLLDSALPVVVAASSFVRAFAAQLSLKRSPDIGASELDLFGDMLVTMLSPLILQQPYVVPAAHVVRRNDVAAICRFIELHLLSSELTPELVAGEFAMSRAVLFRLFKPMGGVATYIRQLRLNWAAARFVEEGASPRNIALVAKKLNFTSIPAFARTFKEQHGFSPADMRRSSPTSD